MLAVVAGTVGGCAGGGMGGDARRQITVSAVPSDADLMIDQRNVGRGPVTERFKFPKDEHRTYTITANRRGDKPQTVILKQSYHQEQVLGTPAPRPRPG